MLNKTNDKLWTSTDLFNYELKYNYIRRERPLLSIHIDPESNYKITKDWEKFITPDIPLFQYEKDRVLWFFKRSNIRYFRYFKKNKSVFREAGTQVKSLIRAINSRGRLEFHRLAFLIIYRKYLMEVFTAKRNPNNKELINYPISYPYIWQFQEIQTSPIYQFMRTFFELNVYFKYSFHSVSRKVRKFSRGKAGKYRCVYNYIPFFKREKYKTKQFKKNLKYMDGKTYNERLEKLVNLYRFNFKRTTLYYERTKAMRRIYYQRYNTVLLRSH